MIINGQNKLHHVELSSRHDSMAGFPLEFFKETSLYRFLMTGDTPAQPFCIISTGYYKQLAYLSKLFYLYKYKKDTAEFLGHEQYLCNHSLPDGNILGRKITVPTL